VQQREEAIVGRVEIYQAGIDELSHDPEGSVAEALERDAYAVENEAKSRLLRPGSGFTYLPGSYDLLKGGKWYHWVRTEPAHTASAPGESPASDIGLLLNTIEHVMDEDDDGIFFSVGSELDIAKYLELGTRLMFPRPFLRPSLDVIGAVPVDEEPEIFPEGPGLLYFTPLDETEVTRHIHR
jgi:hypothetical protein